MEFLNWQTALEITEVNSVVAKSNITEVNGEHFFKHYVKKKKNQTWMPLTCYCGVILVHEGYYIEIQQLYNCCEFLLITHNINVNN